ncbi:MAG: hypothetical protein LBS57_03375 [Treponema sp.]|jgi:hypothetical protein|nr:hypothetical protein [Treponema sp.]
MVDRVLIDDLTLKSRDFAFRWKGLIRKATQLKHYNSLKDEALMESNVGFYPLLARSLDRGIDRALIGDFFVKIGKDRMQRGYPISEVVFAVNLSQQVVIEYLMTDFAPDSTVKMYQAMGAVTRVAEFFLLGSFYLTKGFFEETWTSMSSSDKVSEEFLKKYFRDDFFFKKE